MSKILSFFVFYLVLAIWHPQTSMAYLPDKTHRLINDFAVRMSVLPDYAINVLGFRSGEEQPLNGNRLIEWMKDGGKQEDYPWPGGRGAFHFFDPSKTWANAGLSGWLGIQFYSNLDWALNKTSAPPVPCEQAVTALGTTTCPETSNPDTSWIGARNYFYQALTSSDSNDRGVFFGKVFKSIGHVLHLLTDVAVPEHVRNDWHLAGSSYEAWVEDKVLPDGFNDDGLFDGYDIIKNFISQNSGSNHVHYSTITSLSNPEGYAPISNFWDTTPSQAASANSGDITIMPGAGLAEYTNFNFMSQDTNASYIYPVIPLQNQAYVQFVTDEDGDNHERIYFSGTTTDGKPVNHLVSAGLLRRHLETTSPQSMKNAKFELDDNCYNDYASILVPKAVDYDIALLNYFFRGTLDISWPTTGVYSIADGSQTPYDANGNPHQQFTKLKAVIHNTTPDEPMGAGSLTAVARYKIIPNYAPDLSNYPPDELTMKAVTYSYAVSRTITVTEQEAAYLNQGNAQVTFEFDEHPIPAGITDLTLQVVFKGTLGNEVDNAVAVGMKDLMEPTHLTVWNLTDMFSLQYPGTEYQLYTFEQLQTMAQSSAGLLNWLDITPAPDGNNSLIDEMYLKPYDSTYTLSFWNGTEMIPALTVPIPAGGHIRPIVLTGQTTNNYELKWVDQVESGSVTLSFAAVVNQFDPQTNTYGTPTPLYEFRKGPENGPPYVPIRQHDYVGIVGCKPDVGSINCPYSDEQANPVSATAIPFTSIFNPAQ